MVQRTKSTKPIDRVVAAAGRADAYQRGADSMRPTTPADRAVQRWMSGMAAHFRRLFGERLQGLREQVGLTRNALAVRAGVSPILVTRIESGARSCSFQTAVQIAAALGVELGILAPDPPAVRG
jgi:DNA-binding XRE family transcriptional regulator